MKLQKIDYLRMLIVFPLMLGVFFVLTPKVQAGYSGLSDTLPEETENYRPYLHLTTGSNDAETGNGAWSPTTSIKVYTLDPSSSKTLTLNLASSSGCDDLRFTATTFSVIDSSNSLSNPSSQPFLSGNSSCSNIAVNVPAGAFTDSDISGRDGVYVAMVRLRLTTLNKAISLRAFVDGNTARIGYMGLYPSGSGPEDNSIPSLNRLNDTAVSVRGGSSQPNYNVGVKFAAPCTFFGADLGSPKAVRMYWKDADSRTEVQDTGGDDAPNYNPADNSEVRIRVIDLSNGDYQEINQDALNESGLGDNVIRHVTFNAKYNHKYLVKFDGMTTQNGIRFWSPFDSAGAEFNCKTETAGRTCSIDVTSTGAPRPSSLVAGQGVSVKVNINAGNTPTPPDGLPATINALTGTPYTLKAYVGWNGGAGASDQALGSIPEGGTKSIDVGLGNSPGVGTYSISAFVYYVSADNIIYNGQQYDGNAYFNRTTHSTSYDDLRGSFITCTINVNSYSYFNITPSASNPEGLPDNENPEEVGYRGAGSLDYNPYVPAVNSNYTTNLTIIRQSDGVTSNLATQTNNTNFGNIQFPGPGAANYNFDATAPGRSYGTGTWQAGDQYCTLVTIDTGRGWMGPGGPIDVSANQLRSPDCSRVVNKPYVRFYGQDVFAGGNFSGGTRAMGAINTNYREPAIGSGAEYAAFALGAINGFASNDLRGVGNFFDALNFASSPKGNFGGDHTATDYFANKPNNTTAIASPATPTGGPPATPTNSYIEGDLVLNGNNNFSGRQTIFVRGNVHITGNIRYVPWGADINAIPSFRLIVKGNIYIDRGVSQIDGFLVAQPNGGSGGTISTCANSVGANYSLTTDGTNGECSTKLVINGAIVAQRVKWLRTFKTLSDAKNGGREPYNDSNSAEIINTSPDFYLGIPADPPTGGGTSGKYDSYQALPPIL